MMQQMNKIFTFFTVLILVAGSAYGQELETIVPEKDFPQEYIDVTQNRAHEFVKEMDLSNEKIKQVTDIVAQQYRDLSAIQDTRDAQIKMIEEQFQDKDLIEQLTREIKMTAKLRLDALHRRFIAALTAEVPAEQVNQVKNGMTYNVANVTYNAYLDQLPDLEEEQKTKIRAWLFEAREHAMDAGSSDAKHHIFNDYKGKINNYLSSEGYTLD